MLQYLKTKSVEELHSYFADQLAAEQKVPAEQFSLPGRCYICDKPSTFRIEPAHHTQNWRETLACENCWLINRWRSCFHLFEQLCLPNRNWTPYLTEAVTPLFKLFRQRYPNARGSEYHPGRKPGAKFYTRGRRVEMQDVTALTFDDDSFEAVLSFDVLEHVPDFHSALGEFNRVLKPGGKLLLSVPFTFRQETELRCQVAPDGTLNHLLPPQYHEDPLSKKGVLCFQVFGMDVLDFMATAGFDDAWACCYMAADWGYLGANVMFIGEKPAKLA